VYRYKEIKDIKYCELNIIKTIMFLSKYSLERNNAILQCFILYTPDFFVAEYYGFAKHYLHEGLRISPLIAIESYARIANIKLRFCSNGTHIYLIQIAPLTLTTVRITQLAQMTLRVLGSRPQGWREDFETQGGPHDRNMPNILYGLNHK
jgi:hypothetical protein